MNDGLTQFEVSVDLNGCSHFLDGCVLPCSLELALQTVDRRTVAGNVAFEDLDTVLIAGNIDRSLVNGAFEPMTRAELKLQTSRYRKHVVNPVVGVYAVESPVYEEHTAFQGKIQAVAELECVQQTCRGSQLVRVEFVQALFVVPSACVTCTDERNGIPETSFIVAAQSVEQVDKQVSMDVHYVEFAELVHIVRDKVVEALGFHPAITDTKSHGRRNPLTKINVQCRSYAVAQFGCLALLQVVHENVHTAGYTEECVVEEFTCQVRAVFCNPVVSPDFGIVEVVHRQLCRDNACGEYRYSKCQE